MSEPPPRQSSPESWHPSTQDSQSPTPAVPIPQSSASSLKQKQPARSYYQRSFHGSVGRDCEPLLRNGPMLIVGRHPRPSGALPHVRKCSRRHRRTCKPGTVRRRQRITAGEAGRESYDNSVKLSTPITPALGWTKRAVEAGGSRQCSGLRIDPRIGPFRYGRP